MSTLYYCKMCNTRNHWADERCPRDVRPGDSGGSKGEGEEGNEISKPEACYPSRSDVLPWSAPSKVVESGSYVDSGSPELRGTRVHQKVPKGRRTVPGKKDSVQIPPKLGRPRIHPDRKAYMKTFMVKYRKLLKLRKVPGGT